MDEIILTEDVIMTNPRHEPLDIKKIYEDLVVRKDGHNLNRTVFRPWGYYSCLYKGKGYLIKIISVNSGQKLSVQSHNYRSEHWVVLDGKATVILDDNEHKLYPGQSIDIAIKAKHSLQNPFDDELKIIEIQKGDYLSEDDIIRYEDMYGRV